MIQQNHGGFLVSGWYNLPYGTVFNHLHFYFGRDYWELFECDNLSAQYRPRLRRTLRLHVLRQDSPSVRTYSNTQFLDSEREVSQMPEQNIYNLSIGRVFDRLGFCFSLFGSS